MAKKTYHLNVTVAVPDASRDRPAIVDDSGLVIIPAQKGKRYVAAGDPVSLEREEGERLLARFGELKPAAKG
ncbi:hypothetical protein [Beijerinckia sp. L45]|uniref:hypothetical protein n=1 Tax=Beijerinckia sp. L45 TaxID=1641855 RepID=UPI00131D7059|nr:hypothetical protein [Beijerinckia sp. L45]